MRNILLEPGAELLSINGHEQQRASNRKDQVPDTTQAATAEQTAGTKAETEEVSYNPTH